MKKLFIRSLIACLLTGIFTATGAAQKPAAKATPKRPAVTATPKAPAESEEEAFAKAKDTVTVADRVENLRAFIKNFPGGKNTLRAKELIVSARAQLADEKMQRGDTEGGVALFELAVKEAPEPFSDQLYKGIISLIPRNLVINEQRAAAIRIAKLIEDKSGDNAARMLDLAGFHLNIENADDAQRTAEKAAKADPNSAPAYEALGLAYRTNLKLADAAEAYEKGLKTNTRQTSTVLYLADARRALGKPDEALVLYREVLEKQPDMSAAKTGAVMSLFDAGKRTEAEAELKKLIAAEPKNFYVMAGAAYWYAANNEAAQAVDYAQQAIAAEPRYVWGYVALSRGLMLQKRPIDADRAMLQGAQFGRFPSIDYESASAKLAAGFYDEAAADLKRSFGYKDGGVGVYLAGRIPQTGDSFGEILALERKASIFQPAAADTPENDKKLKELLAFDLKMTEKGAGEADIIAAGEAFIGAADPMQTYRRLYVADRLLKARIAPAKVLELAQSATAGIDTAVAQPSASAAVLAEELFGPRATAASRGTVVTVPEIARPVLTNIMRGRVEELAGWALYQQQKNDEALVRLRRAVAVLPDKSAWWRSSLWKLGVVLEAGGKPEDAFYAYSKSYLNGEPEVTKNAVLQGLCQRLYNSPANCNDRIVAASKAELTSARPSNTLLKSANAPAPSANPAATPAATPAVAGGEEKTPAVPAVAETGAVKEAEKPAQTETEPAPAEEKKPEPDATPVPAAVSGDGEKRPRTVRAKPESGVVYSNPAAQVTVGAAGNEPRAGCQVVLSVPSLSLISNGGWGSIAIDLKGEGRLEDLNGFSESPEDIAVELQPEIGKQIRRRLFVVKSLSDKKGEFKIYFETPCGEKKEVVVTTR